MNNQQVEEIIEKCQVLLAVIELRGYMNPENWNRTLEVKSKQLQGLIEEIGE
ncbi:hypothetical protein M316_0141 [Nitrincola phage 1M3-16]|uniref:hypothetical protein n=1 Tax=Nitrincola phage 1M3-16 TaxID=1472912 RepID=UPI000444E85D|nr:hypothetical protein GJ22_gp011 [Nitrincola phage 1M3-16]AHX01206.1 hypothetical protein M316_0141 [Nitrincola phage 1M3-16]